MCSRSFLCENKKTRNFVMETINRKGHENFGMYILNWFLLTQQSRYIQSCIKNGTQIYIVTREIIHITRYSLEFQNEKVARYTSDRQIHFYNRIDESTTETRNFIPTINRNGLKTNQTILQPKVTSKVVIFL